MHRHPRAFELAILAALASCGLVACAGRPQTAFDRDKLKAERAYSAGSYSEAAGYWSQAARVSTEERDRQEALYREAVSWQRARQFERADRLYAQLEAGRGERAARAAFDRAELASLQGNVEAAFERMRAAVLRFPSSGLARRALQRWLEHVQARGGRDAVLQELRSLEGPLAQTELGSTLLYVRAQQEEAGQEFERARGTYETLVQREPYPVGPYWDEALLALSRLAEREQQYSAAASHLERLLSAREQSWFTGSYERPAFAQARFHLAELWRDHLGSPERAYREFMRVYEEHTTSRLRDDAVFQAARSALSRRDQTAACRAAQILNRDLPESRYARCASVICPSMRTHAGPCPAYIEAELANPSTPEARQAPREKR